MGDTFSCCCGGESNTGKRHLVSRTVSVLGIAEYDRAFDIELARMDVAALESKDGIRSVSGVQFGYNEQTKKDKGEDQASFHCWSYNETITIYAWAIFDGHGGYTTALICADIFLNQVFSPDISSDMGDPIREIPKSEPEWTEYIGEKFAEMDHIIDERKLKGGSTVVLALMIVDNTNEDDPRRQLVISHAGDARALITHRTHSSEDSEAAGDDSSVTANSDKNLVAHDQQHNAHDHSDELDCEVTQLTFDDSPVGDWLDVRRRAEKVLAENKDNIADFMRIPSDRELATYVRKYGRSRKKVDKRESVVIKQILRPHFGNSYSHSSSLDGRSGYGSDLEPNKHLNVSGHDSDDEEIMPVQRPSSWAPSDLSETERKQIPVVSVTRDKGERLAYTVGVTRGLGDFHLKIAPLAYHEKGLFKVKPFMTCKPHVTCIDMKTGIVDLSSAEEGVLIEHQLQFDESDVLVLACDGPFDTLNNRQVISIVRDMMANKGIPSAGSSGGFDTELEGNDLLDKACERVSNRAYASNGGDDMTVFIVPLKPFLC